MPPKRRIRNGSNSSSHILKPIIKSGLSAASTTSLSLLANSSKDVSSVVALNGGGAGGDGLTTKQQQQLDRNNYLSSLTKDQLKVECRKRGQKTTGTKTELLQRLGFKMSTATNNTNVQKTNSGLTKSNLNATTPNGTSISPSSSFSRKQNARDKEKERLERENILLWRHPIQTITYCSYEIVILLQTYRKKINENKIFLAMLLAVIGAIVAVYQVPGKHQILYDVAKANMWFILYWVGLGVVSSVGLGTGLHTFLLYLGPHIASVTLAAYECNSLNFPKPPYPDEIICPENVNLKYIPSLWSIMSKVRPEAFLWGAGTALGELPPYFMARAARLSGYDPDDDEDFKEFEDLQKKKLSGQKLSMLERTKLFVEKIVERVGFFGILACASIPNPLFDLAGITCGHFLVPFWTFFGATLIGKAVIKMHIQKIFVIISFNESLIEKAVSFLGIIPFVGKLMQEPFAAFLQNQKNRLHKNTSGPIKESGNMLSKLFEIFVVAMILYFVISIVNSFAQSYHKRIHKKGGKVHRKVAKD